MQAEGILNRMYQLETGLLTLLWHDVLERFNAVSKTLQDPKIDVITATACLKSLKEFIISKRNVESFQQYEESGKIKSECAEYVQSHSRQRRLNVRLQPLDYGYAPQVMLTPAQTFCVQSYYPILDQLVQSLDQRIAAYQVVCERFGFLRRLQELSDDEMREAVSALVRTYGEDLDDVLFNEFMQFKFLLQSLKVLQPNLSDHMSPEQQMYQVINEKHLQAAFPNIEIVLRMYLVIMSSNCSGERSFSKMKLIKNRLRTILSQERLCSLSLLSIEHDVLRTLDFTSIIEDFAKRKARRVVF